MRRSEWIKLLSLLILLLASPLIVPLLCGIATGAIMALGDIQALGRLQLLRQPLKSEVVQDICLRFDLPSNDSRCQFDAVVYSDDFNNTISDALKTTNSRQLTFDQVEEKLGRYRYECEPKVTQADGTQSFRCYYDLQGDKIFRIGISFFSDGRVWRIYR